MYVVLHTHNTCVCGHAQRESIQYIKVKFYLGPIFTDLYRDQFGSISLSFPPRPSQFSIEQRAAIVSTSAQLLGTLCAGLLY